MAENRVTFRIADATDEADLVGLDDFVVALRSARSALTLTERLVSKG